MLCCPRGRLANHSVERVERQEASRVEAKGWVQQPGLDWAAAHRRLPRKQETLAQGEDERDEHHSQSEVWSQLDGVLSADYIFFVCQTGYTQTRVPAGGDIQANHH